MKTFLIRRISTTKDGREIARDLAAARDVVTVGRALDNDIALPDLAIAAEHALIGRDSAGHVTIAAIGPTGFQIGGKTRKTATIDPDVGGAVQFGGHRITISREATGDIVLTVQRTAAISSALEDRDEARAFSLGGLMPSKRGASWTLAIVVLLAFLAVPVWAAWQKAQPDQRTVYAAHADASWSTGALSKAHHALEGNCEACHKQAFVSVRDATCQSCHKTVHDHAPQGRLAQARQSPDLGGRLLAGVAESFGKEGAGSCVSCHTEHEGAGPMPATAQAFCTDCHATLKQRLADTKLPNAGDFGRAHPQFRPLVATAPGAPPTMVRVSLDLKPTDLSGLKFPHKVHLDKRGGVAAMAQSLKGENGYGKALGCADCHTPTADRTRFLPVDMEQNCQACHSLAFDQIGGTTRTLRHGDTAQMIADLRAFYRSTSPARPVNLGGMARRRPGQYAQGQVYSAYFGAAASRGSAGDMAVRAVFSPGGACYDCHLVKQPGAGSPDWSVVPVNQPARYMMHGWFDHDAHSTETCVSCHAAASSTRASDLLLPKIKTCQSCHGGESSAAKVPSGCAMCHSYHIAQDAPWRPSGAQLSADLLAVRKAASSTRQLR